MRPTCFVSALSCFVLASSLANAAPASFTAGKGQLLCDASGQQAATWSGACKDGLAEGPGTVAWQGGKLQIVGTLAAGVIVGSADLTYADGSTYNGTFRHFVPHGEGFYKSAKGMYEGGMADGKQDGHGVMLWPDRSRYEGDWVHGKREGYGKATFAVGGSYDGQWRNDRFDGPGTIVYAGSGHTFTGTFQDGRVSGAAPPPAMEKATYSYRSDTHPVRSLLPDEVASAGMPGGPWASMNETERETYRHQYLALEAGDEPPYPAQGMRPVALLIKRVRDAFPDYRGPVQVLVLVGVDGKAESVTTVGKVPADVSRYVSSALVATRWKSAVCRGVPCPMNFSVSFVLE